MAYAVLLFFFSKVSFSFIAPLGQLGTKCLAYWEGREIASHRLCYVRLMGSTRCYATSARMMYGDTVSFKADVQMICLFTQTLWTCTV